ncbi:nuclear RNA export factor 1 [Trichonephila inaurata madagascariensis]|uniref:Nuclear RNA export factor 1 n=1 Tax=Trichonephila inaurata madagascariensis TaxID=2747483 RepID=A0A8X6XEI6_9ARAC|nr:nuclear RNA export factor 1 [Trichonephila inaurata madagascariensis]
MSRQVFFEHDSRGPSSSVFRPSSSMGRQRKFRDHPRGNPSGKSLLHNFDGDVEMIGAHNAAPDRRYNPYGPRQHNSRKKYKKPTGSKSKRNHGHQDKEVLSWYKIQIPHGKKSGKMFILKSLQSVCDSPLMPINFHFSGNFAEFYVNDHDVADQVKRANRKITTPDGFKLLINVGRCSIPVFAIDPESEESIKNCMSSRYDAISHTLNLSKFHSDPSLKALGLFVALNKSTILGIVAKIIKEHIPEIEVLDLSDNRLYIIDSLTSLVPVCKQLKSLILRNNKLRSVAELNSLKGLEITDLILDGNPLCDDFKDKTTYISAIRDRFPKLINLDGHSLPAPIGFDLGPETFPVSKKSFLAADDVKDLVIQFLDQYYTIYDSGDRTKLLDAYHDQANFSLCLSKHSHKSCNGTLASYNLDNRDLLKVNDYGQRFKLLKQGKLSIVNALSELPQTMHDPTSFSVDIFHISPGLMSFSVVGVFKEVGADINNATLKTFSRTYVVVAQGQGFVITNETLFIAHASQDQQSKAFKVPAPTPSPSPAPSTEEKSAHEKQLLVIELSKQTGMNLEFSTKCLEENDWDPQRAFAVFLKFQTEGKLPPEAFITM